MMPARPKSFLAVFEGAAKATPWLTDSDAATVDLARHLALAVDRCDDSRELAMLAKQLNETLTLLGMNPHGRGQKAPTPREEVNPLDQLKEKAAARIASTATANAKPQSRKPRAVNQ